MVGAWHIDFGKPFRKRKSEIKCEAFYCSEIQLQRFTADKLPCLSFSEGYYQKGILIREAGVCGVRVSGLEFLCLKFMTHKVWCVSLNWWVFFSMIDLGSAIKIDLPLNFMSLKYSRTHLCSETKENITLLLLDDFTDFERYWFTGDSVSTSSFHRCLKISWKVFLMNLVSSPSWQITCWIYIFKLWWNLNILLFWYFTTAPHQLISQISRTQLYSDD